MEKQSTTTQIGPLVIATLVLLLAACVPLSQANDTIEDPDPTAIPSQEAEVTTTIGGDAVTRYETLILEDGTEVEYAVVLPAGFDASQEYPTLLALPPGGQTRDMVDAGLGFWADGAMANGWVVLSPVAPGGTLFFNGSEESIPEFLEKTREKYRPEGDKYHIIGISNGGISSFRIAGNNPHLVHSVLVLPGFARSDEDKQNLAGLIDIPVAMFVGENDTSWVRSMQETADTLSDLGGTVSLEIVPNEGHVIRSLGDGARLYELLESFRISGE